MSNPQQNSYLIPVTCSLVVYAKNEAEAAFKAKTCIQTIGKIGGTGVRIFMEPGDPVQQIGAEDATETEK